MNRHMNTDKLDEEWVEKSDSDIKDDGGSDEDEWVLLTNERRRSRLKEKTT